MLKICGKCKISKTLDSFHKNKSRPDGLQITCIVCNKLKSKEHYSKNSESHKLRVKNRKVKNTSECIDFICNYLKLHPCVDCGESNLLVLDFDHTIRGSKRFSVSRAIGSGYNLKHIELEMGKCIVRCANCHRKKTAKESGWRKLSYL